MTETPRHAFVEELTWDRKANAAYLAMKSGASGPHRAASTLVVDNKDGQTVAALDFAADGTLLGAELLDADAQSTPTMKLSAIDITDSRPTS